MIHVYLIPLLQIISSILTVMENSLTFTFENNKLKVIVNALNEE